VNYVYEQYRLQAGLCRELSERAGNAELAQEWLQMAAGFLAIIPESDPAQAVYVLSEPESVPRPLSEGDRYQLALGSSR